jgi:hypothetical protein
VFESYGLQKKTLQVPSRSDGHGDRDSKDQGEA